MVNGIPASCRNRNCRFLFSNETHEISSISPTSGGQDGSLITIYGKRFPDDISRIVVTIGDQPCDVITASSTEITCIPSPNEAGFYPILVHVDNIGYAVTMNNEPIIFEYVVEIEEVEPSIGSVFGGNLIWITGVGFPELSESDFVEYSKNRFSVFFSPSIYILLDGYPCFIESSNFTHISCLPQAHDEDIVNVIVSINDVQTVLTDAYEYSINDTSCVISVTPVKGPVYGGTELTISGENFGSDVSVKIGRSFCAITSLTDNEIVCTTAEHPPGTQVIFVHSTEFGVAYTCISSLLSNFQNLNHSAIPLNAFLPNMSEPDDKQSSSDSDLGEAKGDEADTPFPIFTYDLVVTGLTPCTGSLVGGTEVIIYGSGFGLNKENVTVIDSFGEECMLTYVSYEVIKCVTQSTRREHVIDNSGTHTGR